MAGLQLSRSLLVQDELEPTSVHLFPARHGQPRNLVMVGDKAGQISIFDFSEQDDHITPLECLKPEGIIEISCMEHLQQGPYLVVGKRRNSLYR